MDRILEFVNQPIVISVFAAVVLYALNYLYAKKPLWQKYEGAIVSAIRYAERAVPDGSDNTAINRLDAALKVVCSIYEEVEKKRVTPKVLNQLTEGINIIHNELDSVGVLDKNKKKYDKLES